MKPTVGAHVTIPRGGRGQIVNAEDITRVVVRLLSGELITVHWRFLEPWIKLAKTKAKPRLALPSSLRLEELERAEPRRRW